MKRVSSLSFAMLACAALAALGACEETRKPAPEQQPSEPSPNASILPAPLASEVEPELSRVSLVDAGRPDAGPEPAPQAPRRMREDQPEPDGTLRDSSGVRSFARIRWLDLPPAPRLPEMNLEAINRLKELLAFEVSIELAAAGRMRVLFDSDAFSLPRGGELRARLDRTGHVLLWSSGTRYTVLPPGTLRAVLNEHRIDTAPLAKPKASVSSGVTLLGLTSERSELVTPLGRMLIDQTALPNAGSAGKLLCRLLSELIAADPLNVVCERGLLPLRAEIFSRSSGHLLFETQRIERDHTGDATLLQTPPMNGEFLTLELPPLERALVASPEHLRELRVRALPRAEKPESGAPREGLWVINRGDTLRYVLLDGAVVARVPARAEFRTEALVPGKYGFTALDFLGDDPLPPRVVELPARVVLGEEAEPVAH